jgi:Ran GTPase-activating protein (RanGAP) involved in mRNA processing and transport
MPTGVTGSKISSAEVTHPRAEGESSEVIEAEKLGKPETGHPLPLGGPPSRPAQPAIFPVDHLPRGVLLQIASMLTQNEVMELSATTKSLERTFASQRAAVKSAANFDSAHENYTGDQVSFAKKFLRYDSNLFDKVGMSEKRLARQFSRTNPSTMLDRYATLDLLFRSNGYPPLAHILDKNGNCTPAGRRLLNRDTFEKWGSKVGMQFSPEIFSKYFETRRERQLAPSIKSEQLWNQAVEMVIAGKRLGNVAKRLELSCDELRRRSIAALTTGNVAPLKLNFGLCSWDQPWSNDEIAAIACAVWKHRLTELDLERGAIGDEGSKHIQRLLAKNKTLERLRLSGCKLGEASRATKLCEALRSNSTLRNLDLGANQIGAAGAKPLSSMLCENRALRTLGLSGNRFGDEGINALVDGLSQNPTLLELDLSSNEIGVKGAMYLCNMLRENSHLTTLRLGGNPLGNGGAAHLAEALSQKSSLQALRIHVADIGSEGAKAVGSMLSKNHTLQKLDLSRNPLGDAGVEELVKGLKANSTLLDLDISFTKMGPAGAQHLIGMLKGNTTLRELALLGNNLGDKSALDLAAAAIAHPALATLDMSHSNVSAKTKKKIQTMAAESGKTILV